MVCAGDHSAEIMKLFPHSVAQPGPTSVQMPCMSGLHVPAERSRRISGCSPPHLSPSTLAKWKSGVLTCRVCGEQELLGWRGWDSARNGDVGFVREARGCQVSVRVTSPLARVTGCVWHCAVTHGAQTYFKHSWGGEQSDLLEQALIFHPRET